MVALRFSKSPLYSERSVGFMDFCGDFMDNSEKIIRKWLNRVGTQQSRDGQRKKL